MKSSSPVILVIDDEPQIRRFLRASLSAHDYGFIEAGTIKEGMRAVTTRDPDLIILDLGLPDGDGKDIISELREWSQTPIIVLSVRDEETEKVKALDCGADDYLTKPFGMDELMARLRVCLRNSRHGDAGEESPVIELGHLTIDLAAHEVRANGEPVSLSPKEFEVLAFLARNEGRVVTHRQLLEYVWGPAHANEVQYLRVYIAQLRRKLETDPAQPRIIATEAGIGYRLLDPSDH